MKKVFTAVIALLLLASCQLSPSKEESVTQSSSTVDSTGDYTLIGKKAKLVYPQFTAEVSYLTDSTLHWKTTTPDGKISEGEEHVFLKRLNDYQYFLNWIEKDGLTISQVIDVKASKVTAFGTYADENSPRGKRSGMRLEGSFEFVK